jgi:hypothetical protein
VRRVLGFVAGALVWTVGFFVLASALAALWPDYGVHARQWVREGLFTFTAPMAVCNLLLWVLAGIGAGWTAAKIAQHRRTVWLLAGLIGIYLAAVHLGLDWSRFPWWYNLGVVIPAVPAVLLGALVGTA